MRGGVGWSILCVLTAAAPDACAAPVPKRILYYSGTDLSSVSGFVWSGADISLNPSRDVSGAVLRLMGGGGRYDYAKDDAPDGKVIGTVMLGEVLAGWRQIGTALCIGVFGGFVIENHDLDTPDPGNEVQGTESGVKIAAELFWRPSERTQIEAHATYASPFDFWRARIAGGVTAWRGIVVGAETETFGNVGSHQVRLGVFASDITWRAFRFKAAAGGLYDGEEAGAYARIGTERAF